MSALVAPLVPSLPNLIFMATMATMATNDQNLDTIKLHVVPPDLPSLCSRADSLS